MQLLLRPIWCGTARYLPLALLFWAGLGMANRAYSGVSAFELTIPKPEYVLPTFTGPYQEREASIAPDEYERAEKLRSLLAEGRRELVIEELKKSYSIELSPALLTLQAQVYFSLGLYDEAEESYLEVLERMPQLIRAHADLGQLYLVRDKPLKAREHFARAVALGCNEANIHGQLGYLNLTHFGPFSAISSYQQAAALEPEKLQWQQGLLAALTQARMFDAAEALIKDLQAQQPNKPELWLNQAALRMQKNDTRGALIGIEMAILLGDKDPKNIKSAAQLHLQLGSFDRALELLDQSSNAGELPMESIREYYSWLSQFGLWDKAEHLLTSAGKNLRQLSRNDQSQYYLLAAQLKAAQNQTAAAEGLFQQALEANATNSDALLAFAAFALKQKKFADAELLFIRAEATPQAQKKAQLGRAQLYIDTQDYQGALHQLRAVLQKYPETVEAKDTIEIIENIIRTQAATAL
jgi:tetratricopeptide (TPR) repeat protein